MVPHRDSGEGDRGADCKNGLTYREIPEGTLVGAIEFPAKFTDFRKQELAAGVYTLRFAVQPDIGDHTGTAPHPEFCLICAAEDDRSAEEIEKKKLIELVEQGERGAAPGGAAAVAEQRQGRRA